MLLRTIMLPRLLRVRLLQRLRQVPLWQRLLPARPTWVHPMQVCRTTPQRGV
jgi:hypothetical protein